ncbi:TetR/AcrR family transcriptional regulator [Oricola sp.]|uniref:TetR/AcrR family transcriptional regulator n=1 Tax=Oricola sp. TaxID=1979950 RepID=UPI003BAB82A4
MNDREINILETAFGLFLRYGVKRTAMNDIAAEAGIARQTLYNAFSNKDDVLRAMIRLFTERAIAEIEAGLETRSDLGERLDLIFEHIAVRPFETLNVSPNAADIIDGMNSTSRDEIIASAKTFRGIVERVLGDYEDQLAAKGHTIGVLSELIHLAAAAAKSEARDRAQLDTLLAELRQMVLNAIA